MLIALVYSTITLAPDLAAISNNSTTATAKSDLITHETYNLQSLTLVSAKFIAILEAMTIIIGSYNYKPQKPIVLETLTNAIFSDIKDLTLPQK